MRRDCTFDWFSLDRLTLFGILYSTHDSIVNQKLTIDQIHSKLVKKIRSFLPVKTKKTVDPKVEKGWIYVGGAYYNDKDEDNQKAIEIEFCYHHTDKTLTITPRRFSRLCLGFADTILHEIIHMRQHRRRNFKVLPDYPSTSKREKQRQEQQYLGCRDEVDAYAFNIACELHDKFNGNQKKVMKYLNETKNSPVRKNNSYGMYLRAFGYDHSHPVIKLVKKKVVSYFPQAEIGKPYRNSDWINH